MNGVIHEKNKIPGLCYAVSDDRLELPVVDITHPAFRFEITPAELAAIEEQALRRLRKSSRTPGFLLRYLAKRSIVMRDTMQAAGGYLSGMGTYLHKLGPDNLGRGYAGRIDRRLIASIGPLSGRIRLRNMVRLIVDGLAPALTTGAKYPLHLLNIGGGTAMDSLNAVILIRKEQPRQMDDRQVVIHVLDLDTAGPGFGARALAAVTKDGGPLAGVDASFNHIRYDWTDPAPLRKVLDDLKDNDAVIAGSSEGGLFEYGSDDDITANLTTIREGAPADFIMVGSVIRDGRLSRVMKEVSRFTFRAHDLEGFKVLVARAGWMVETVVEDNPLYYVVSLKRA